MAESVLWWEAADGRDLEHEPGAHRIHGGNAKHIAAPQLREKAGFGAGHPRILGQPIARATVARGSHRGC